MTDQEIIALRVQVRNTLQNLSPSIYPYFAGLSATADGLCQAEDIVLTYAATNNVGLLTAIAQLESEYAE